jgi:hypothetical protein
VASIRAQAVARGGGPCSETTWLSNIPHTTVRQLASAECMRTAIKVESQSAPERSLRGAAQPPAAADFLAAGSACDTGVQILHFISTKLLPV